ncbi:MAG TPA: hypothetical protein VIC55_07075 [Gemmatimonadaceae bacterium]
MSVRDMAADRTSTGLRLGAAKAVITPPVGSELSGFIARTAPMIGVHDDLYARALVWADNGVPGRAVALVTLDLIDLDAASIDLIRKRAAALSGIPAEHIGVTCTHTHGGPVTLPGRWLGVGDSAYLDTVCKTAAGIVATAARRTEPVVMRWACGTESTVGKNRRVLGGVIDPDVPVVRFQRPDGTVAALLTSYACHPVTLGPDNLQATRDYPGHAVRTLEAIYPGAFVLFATGCCGQINTGHTARDGMRQGGGAWRSHGEAERLGRMVAAAAAQAAERASRDDAALAVAAHTIRPALVRLRRRVVHLPLLPNAPPAELEALVGRWRAERTRLERTGHGPGDIGPCRVGEEWAAALRAGRLPDAVSAEVMVIALGEVSLVLLPGEMFVEFGLTIKAHAAPRAVMTLAYANGTPGYIPHRSAYSEGGYEVDEAYRYYGYPACFAPETGEALVATACALLDELAALDGSPRDA